MPTVAVTVTDTVTYERTALLLIDVDDAEDEDLIEELALKRASDGDLEWDEEQIDNTPYEASILDTEDAGTLIELLHDERRPAGLDGDERKKLKSLKTYAVISHDEIRRFRDRHPIEFPHT